MTLLKNGRNYTIQKLTRSSKHWPGVEQALARRSKPGSSKLRLSELYEVRWRDKPFRFRFSDFDANKRWFYHGTTLQNIEKIMDEGFQIKTARTGRMLGDGIYATYHPHKGAQYGPETYMLSVMVYAPKTYLVNPRQSISSSFIQNAPSSYDAIEVRSSSNVGGYTMQNHEICVYDCSRIQPRFILKIN